MSNPVIRSLLEHVKVFLVLIWIRDGRYNSSMNGPWAAGWWVGEAVEMDINGLQVLVNFCHRYGRRNWWHKCHLIAVSLE